MRRSISINSRGSGRGPGGLRFIVSSKELELVGPTTDMLVPEFEQSKDGSLDFWKNRLYEPDGNHNLRLLNWKLLQGFVKNEKKGIGGEITSSKRRNNIVPCQISTPPSTLTLYVTKCDLGGFSSPATSSTVTSSPPTAKNLMKSESMLLLEQAWSYAGCFGLEFCNFPLAGNGVVLFLFITDLVLFIFIVLDYCLRLSCVEPSDRSRFLICSIPAFSLFSYIMGFALFYSDGLTLESKSITDDLNSWATDTPRYYMAMAAVMGRVLIIGYLEVCWPSFSLFYEATRGHAHEFLQAIYAIVCIWLIAAVLSHSFDKSNNNVASTRKDEALMGRSRVYSVWNALPLTFIHITGDYPVFDYSYYGRWVHGGLMICMVALLGVPIGLFCAVLTRHTEVVRSTYQLHSLCAARGQQVCRSLLIRRKFRRVVGKAMKNKEQVRNYTDGRSNWFNRFSSYCYALTEGDHYGNPWIRLKNRFKNATSGQLVPKSRHFVPLANWFQKLFAAGHLTVSVVALCMNSNAFVKKVVSSQGARVIFWFLAVWQFLFVLELVAFIAGQRQSARKWYNFVVDKWPLLVRLAMLYCYWLYFYATVTGNCRGGRGCVWTPAAPCPRDAIWPVDNSEYSGEKWF